MRTRLIFSVGIAMAASAFGLRAAEPAGPADSIQAVVNDTPITQLQIERITLGDEDKLFDQYRNQPELYRKKVMDLRHDGSEALIEREVIIQDFKQNLKIPESILDEVVQDRIKERFQGDNVRLTKQLELEGITKEQLKKNIREQFIINVMHDRFVPEPIISPKKVEDFYTAHRNDFKLEDQIRMRMIVLNKRSSDTAEDIDRTRKRAAEILSQLKGGAAFSELARTYSEGSTARDGGDTGWEDVSVLNKVLMEPLNKLKAGENSDVIDAPEAFYILHLEDRHPAHFKPLNDVRPEIERTLAAFETKRLRDKWLARLKTKTFIIKY